MPPSDTITVAIIDDNRLVREALTAMLNRLTDVRVVSSDVADSAFLAETKPQVLLLDVGLRDQDSLRVAATLKQENPGAKIILMDLLPVNEEIMEFVNAGVSGFVLKDATFDEFVGTIRSVAAGKKVLPPRMTESLFSQIAREADGQERAHVLEDVRLCSPVEEVWPRRRRGHAVAGQPARVDLQDGHQAIGLRKWQRPEQDRIDDAEHRRVHANAQRKRDDGDERKSWGLA